MTIRIATHLAISVALYCALPLTSEAARRIDPLSRGPLSLTRAQAEASRQAVRRDSLGTDEACTITTADRAASEIDIATLPSDICDGRSNELVSLPKRKALVACLSQKIDFVAKVSLGSNGIGKTVQGNRKSPIGTYWLGHPRRSDRFGIFIPVGYPNMDDIAKGYTGQDIGIHGPIRALKCHPIASLAGNWTAGCLAMGRDSQVIALSEWILNHWPVKITMTDD